MTATVTRIASLLAAAVVALALPVGANHAQTDSGRVIVFDHVAGNEWWVEVALSGQDAGSVASVEAMDTNGAWTPLAKKSWGPYAASFHIEPGNQVRFRANWAGGAQQVSCWFTHPAGAEQCATPPPPPPPPSWRVTHAGDAGLYSSQTGDLAISDVDNDGRRDVTQASNRGLRVFEWSGSAWTTELITSLSLGGVAAGDGNGDGINEIYAVQDGRPDGQPGTSLHRFEKAPSGWFHEVLFGFDETNVGDMTLGSIDGLAGPELYVGLYEGWCDPSAPGFCIANSTVYHIFHNGDFWDADVAAEPSGHIDSMWIGDGDGNGASELYVGHGTRHADRTTQVLRYQGQWSSAELPGSGSDSGNALTVAGDGDRDGRKEVYTINWYGHLRKMTYDQVTGWSDETLFDVIGYNPISLFLGDADSDGSQELYFTEDGGGLVQVRWSGSAWTVLKVAQPSISGLSASGAVLVVGDGDGDTRREAYLAVGFLPEQTTGTWDTGATKVFKVDVPPTTFDASFTGVKGNEWWQQASVSATGGALAKVDVRLNGGTWQPMTKQSYGWTSSIRAVQGTVVQFQATSTTGAADLSACYQWIPPSGATAATVPCSGTPPPAFDATFSGVKGNEWWVQASVSANEPLAKVEARVDCGAWKALAKQSYGWAASFHVPSGSKVDLRATSTGGATDLSGGYAWPAATPTAGC